MQKITFTDATLQTQGFVTINGVNTDIVDTTYSGGTELSASTFNQLQSNIENAAIDNLNGTDSKTFLAATQGKVLNDKFKWTKLWTNPNPTSAFTAQSIILNSSDYDELMFVFDVYANFKQLLTVTTLKGYGLAAFSLLQDGTGALRKMQRLIDRTNDTTYSIGISIYDFGTSAVSVDNSQLVPLFVFGRNTGINN